MYLESLTFSSFRCFGRVPVTITFEDDLTVLIGKNGSGKSATLLALMRMFGSTADARRVIPEDFHVSPLVSADENGTPPPPKEMWIEAIFAFPECEKNAEELNESDRAAIAGFFQSMSFQEDGRLICRIRLHATLTKVNGEDEVQSNLWAILGKYDDQNTANRSAISSTNRALIQVAYIPPGRDSSQSFPSFLKSRIWKSGKFDAYETKFGEVAKDLLDAFGSTEPLKAILAELQDSWSGLNSENTYKIPSIRPIAADAKDSLQNASISFASGPNKDERDPKWLSDGQRSMLHISLAHTNVRLERAFAAGKYPDAFHNNAFTPPVLTLVCLEEPENSLTPFHLSRILADLKNLIDLGGVQGIVSSHSANMLHRIHPKSVRHFFLNEQKRRTRIRPIRLPEDSTEEYKFISQAVRAYPELYFAAFVILCEGDSERSSLPILWEALDGLGLDKSFVAVVPLGGRHVDHMWRLLEGLDIPYVTLLDMDVGRSTGGSERIRNILSHLIALNKLEPSTPSPLESTRTIQAEFELLGDFPCSDDQLPGWCTFLEQQDVFFSYPLDFDLLLFQAFPDAYKVLKKGSRYPKISDTSFDSVLKVEGNKSYYVNLDEAKYKEEFSWYRYLFLGDTGKPSRHIQVLVQCDSQELLAGMPDVVKRISEKVKKSLGLDGADQGQPNE